jgi:uncharacterized membrane protein
MKKQMNVSVILLWSAVILLTAFGLLSVVNRAIVTVRGGPVNAIDRRYTEHAVVTFVHIAPGALFLALAPLQFVGPIRRRWLSFHRTSGRVLVGAALAAGASAFVVGTPSLFGPIEVAARAVFGTFFLVAVLRAFFAIRRGDVTMHREWMIRTFAMGIGISTIRIIAVILLATVPRSIARTAFALSFWIGWALMLSVAELWIRRTRPEPVAVREAAVA